MVWYVPYYGVWYEILWYGTNGTILLSLSVEREEEESVSRQSRRLQDFKTQYPLKTLTLTPLKKSHRFSLLLTAPRPEIHPKDSIQSPPGMSKKL